MRNDVVEEGGGAEIERGFFGSADFCFSTFVMWRLLWGGCFGICEICLGWLRWYLVKIDFWLGNRGFSIGSGLWFNSG